MNPLLQVANAVEHCCAQAGSTVDGSADGGVAQEATINVGANTIAIIFIRFILYLSFRKSITELF